MSLLLDTHAFLWFVADDERFSQRAADAIAGGREVWLSAVTALEIAIKAGGGKLELAESAPRFVSRHRERNDLRELPVSIEHALTVHDLPLHHRDPFDRLLVAQACCEQLSLVSGDPALGAYGVPLDLVRTGDQAAATAPPRRGSPAARSAPVAGSRSTAWAPPKKRLGSRKRTSSRAPPSSSSSGTPGSA